MRQYYVYILSSKSRSLYVGVTSNLEHRMIQHRAAEIGHTAKYRITRLVYYEIYDDIRYAIAREKQIKRYLRAKKIALINAVNPTWDDLLPSS